HGGRQAERWNVGAHEPATLGVLLKEHAAVAEGHEIAGHGEGGGSGTDERNSFAVLRDRNVGHEGVDLTLIIGGDALEAAHSTRPRRHAGSQGRSQTRPKMPGKTLLSQFSM